MRRGISYVFLLIFSIVIGWAGLITFTSILRFEAARPYFLGLLPILIALIVIGRMKRIRQGVAAKRKDED